MNQLEKDKMKDKLEKALIIVFGIPLTTGVVYLSGLVIFNLILDMFIRAPSIALKILFVWLTFLIIFLNGWVIKLSISIFNDFFGGLK